VNFLSSAATKAILLALAFSAPSPVSAEAYPGPKCLGPYCVGQPVLEQSLVSQLETPGDKAQFWHFLAVFKSTDGNACLDLRENADRTDEIVGILLRDTTHCPGQTSKANLRDWKTPDGVGLGSSEKDVIGAYGRPTSEKSGNAERDGECAASKIIFYSGKMGGSLRTTTFGFRGGRVSCIGLSNLEYSGPRCLGRFCRNQGKPIISLLRELGLPPGVKPVQGNYCLQSPDGQAFMFVWAGRNYEKEHEEDDLFLSDFPNCQHVRENPVTDDLRAWKTEEGIGLGSPVTEVLNAYGKPPREWSLSEQMVREKIVGIQRDDKSPNAGERFLFYYGLGSRSTAEFGIRDGKVSYIWLLDSW
jgi:hypothetical protein